MNVSRPIRSPVRSRPRTSTRSGYAWLIRVTGSPALPITAAAPSTIRAPATIALSLRNASSRVRYFIPQSGATTSRSGGSTSRARSIRVATTSGVSASLEPRSRTPRTIDLVRDVSQHLRVELRLRGLEREMGRRAAVELAEERVAVEPLVDDVGVAEAGVQHRLALDSLERAVDGLDRVPPGRLGTSLQVRLVDLDDVGAGRLQVSELLVDGLRVREREAALVAVVIVLRLLRHRERPGHGDLDPAVGERTEELDVAEPRRAARGGSGRRRAAPGSRGPVRSSATPGVSRSTPSSAVAKRLE